MTTSVSSPPSDRTATHSATSIDREAVESLNARQGMRPGSPSTRTPTSPSTNLPPNASESSSQPACPAAMAANSSPASFPSTPPRRVPAPNLYPWQSHMSINPNVRYTPWNPTGFVASALGDFHHSMGDPYLAAIVNGEFSSPSSYPSFTNPPQSPVPRPYYTGLGQAPAPASGPNSAPLFGSTAPREDPSAFAACNLDLSAPERSDTQLTTSTSTSSTNALESQNTTHTDDSFEQHDLIDTPSSSFDETMPPSTRRRPRVATPPLDSVHRSKRRRTSANAPSTRSRKSPRAYAPETKDLDNDDSIFDLQQSRTTPEHGTQAEDLATIDLTEVNEVPEELKKPEKDNRIKIAAFQCVICMDDVTTLTVTHCGKFNSHTSHLSFMLTP